MTRSITSCRAIQIIVCRIIICFCLLAVTLVPARSSLAESSDSTDLPGLIADSIDSAADIGFGAFDFVFLRVREGLSSVRRSIKVATNIIRNGPPSSKRLAAAYRKQQIKNRARIKRERKALARFAKRIIRIAASGADVPVSLATRTANKAAKIFSIHARIIQVEAALLQLQNRFEDED